MERGRASLFGKVSASPREGWYVRFQKVCRNCVNKQELPLTTAIMGTVS